MLLLALLLAAATAAFVGLAIAGNIGGGPDYNVSILGNHIATLNSLAIFSAGLALALLFAFFLVMAVGGGHRRRRWVTRRGTATAADEPAPRTRGLRARHRLGH